jgi:hypothetical protein
MLPSILVSAAVGYFNPVAGQAETHIFSADNREDLQKWMEAFWQHFFDLSKLTFGFSNSIFM